MRRAHALAPVFALALLAAPDPAKALDGPAGPLAVETMAKGLDEPWSVAFLPGGDFLVTERDGRLRRYGPAGGEGRRISGVPDVYDRGRAGFSTCWCRATSPLRVN